MGCLNTHFSGRGLARPTSPTAFLPGLQGLTHRVHEVDVVHKVPLPQVDGELGRRGTRLCEQLWAREHTPEKPLALALEKTLGAALETPRALDPSLTRPETLIGLGREPRPDTKNSKPWCHFESTYSSSTPTKKLLLFHFTDEDTELWRSLWPSPPEGGAVC